MGGMMADQTVVWTALPNGATGDGASRRLRLSVFVSPRLTSAEPQPTLASFADFLVWPHRLAAGQVAFSVQTRAAPGSPPRPLVLATVVSPPPDPDLWQAVFGPSTPVESHRADQVSRVYSTYSMSAVHDQLKQGHQALAVNSPVELPGLATLRAGVPASDAFAPMAGEQVIATLAPAPDADEAALHGVLNSLAANMFRSDNTTDISQRVSAAILHARELAQRSGEPVEVMPRALRDGTGIVEPASELARVVAYTRGSVVAPPVPPAAPSPAALAAAPPPPAAPPAAGPPAFDFHHYLTFLADHPSLLRLLGLVIDLEVPAGSLPVSPSTAPGPQLVQVLPTFAAPLEGTLVSPYTAYVLEGGGESFFAAAPAPGGPEILHGLLNLTLAGQYDLIQIDVQGGALKLINTLAGQAAGQSPGSAGDQTGGLPAMRTSGVSIARADLAQRYVERTGTAAQNNAVLEAATGGGGSDPPVLFAEDLTRGYRFDVFDTGARQWRSLHQRAGTYTFRQHPGGPVTMPADGEGVVQHVSTQPPGGDGLAPDPGVEHYIHESLMHWQGWSLSAPRPGKTITDDGPATIATTAPAGGPQVDAAFQAKPGSLPRLRFGGRYRFRARTVDLAGNGPGLDEATALLDKIFPSQNLKPPILPQADDFIYRRFEPVLSPVLVPRARLTEGETLERLVIRSRTGVGAAQEASDLAAASAAGAAPAAHYQPTCERHLVPPKISQHMAETHGLFDASFGGQGGFTATYAIARKEKGRLTDTTVIDIGTGQPVPISDPSAVEVVPTNPPSGDGYVIHGEPQLALPYLPDPMARAAALFGLPGVPSHTPAGTLDGQGQLVFGASSLPPDVLAQLAGSTVHIPFTAPGGDQWPGRLPFRLIVAERTPDAGIEPRWDPQARTLTVFLAQAEQATVRLSSSISLDDLLQLGQWQWLVEASPGGVATDVAEQGGRWQLTPGRTLSLVHAVEQPLLAPDVKALAATRDPGATFCFLGGLMAAHGESTAKIDLLASWEDAADPPGAPPVPVQAHVFDIPIDLAAEGGEPLPQDPAIVPVATYDPSARELTIQAPPPGDESGRTYLARHEFGDTRHRTVRYSAVASTRFRDCFPAEIADDASRTTLTGAAMDVSVPSSSRPAAPDLVSVLPAFTWSRETHPDGSRVSIRNGSIRLYLRRPWYSSGSGELLAVLLTDPVNYPPDDMVKPLVTHWGRDPIWGQSGRLDPPAPKSFPRAVSTAQGLHPDELPEANLVAVAHDVAHDPQRDLLYCDIAINPAPDPYYPFVRLALARYQPDSLPGLELSRVVLADYVQVPPQRTVTVAPDPGPDTFLVDVQGFSPLKFPFLFVRLVRVSVEQRIPGVEDADLGWAPVPDDMPGVAITATVANQAPTLWHGQVTLPAGRDKGQFRIVIREVEPLPSDASGGAPDPDGRPVFAETMVM